MPTEPDCRFATVEDMRWWRDARFGMFIHWGPAALGGGDISWCRQGTRRGDHQHVAEPRIPAAEYDGLHRRFNPTRYEAAEWVAIARAAGMKYMVLTAKHHDGFCLFDSRFTDHRVTGATCPFGRDIVAELATACHAAGMRLGFYYSARDWFHPDYLTERHARYLAFYHAQLLELLCNYGRVDILWLDHVGDPGGDLGRQWDPELVLRMARRLQPGILVNDRLHRSVRGLSDPRYAGDFDTPEQRVGAYRTDRAWESCLCLVGGVWSYKPGGEMMTVEQCVHALVQCAGGDGNLLLNTGPMPDGRIEPRQAERLGEVGRWLDRSGEAVYGTRGGPFRPAAWGVSTRRGRTVYLHLLRPGAGGPVALPPTGRRLLRHRLLTGGEAAVTQTPDGGLSVDLPPASRDPLDTILALEFDGEVPEQKEESPA